MTILVSFEIKLDKLSMIVVRCFNIQILKVIE